MLPFLFKYRTIIILFFSYFVFGIIVLLKPELKYDELNFHLPTLQNFYSKPVTGAVTGNDYLAANTPMPYIIGSIILKPLNIYPGVYQARIINMIFSILTLLAFYCLCRNVNGREYLLLFLFFYPYFLKTSFYYFMAIYGLLFFFLSICFLGRKGPMNIFIAGVFTSCAVLSQQFYLLVPFGYLAFKWFFNSEKETAGSLVRESVLFTIPLIVPAMLFIAWGGLTHHNFRAHSLSFQVSNITSVLIITGSALLPFFIIRIKNIGRITLAAAGLASVLLVLFASPVWANGPARGMISGYTFHTIELSAAAGYSIPVIIKTFLALSGICSFYQIYRELQDGRELMYFILAAVFAAGFVFNELISERHLIPLVALLFMLTVNKVKSITHKNLWLGFQAALGLVYFFYMTFLQKSAMG